jgi:hypothetical protein
MDLSAMALEPAGAAGGLSLRELDDELACLPGLSDDERHAVWLYAWASREMIARVAVLTA